MTTIVYNHKDKQIACDSRTTAGSVIVSDKDIKMQKVNGVKFFLCGSVPDYELLIDMYFTGEPSKVVPEASALVIDNGIAYKIGTSDDGVPWKQPLDHDDSIGSGGQFALSAMDFGCSARGAVKYAATRDIYTGGRIRVYDVK